MKQSETYTMILLIGMWINLIVNPIKPIIKKPMATACETFKNSTTIIELSQTVSKVHGTTNIKCARTFPVLLSIKKYNQKEFDIASNPTIILQ